MRHPDLPNFKFNSRTELDLDDESRDNGMWTAVVPVSQYLKTTWATFFSCSLPNSSRPLDTISLSKHFIGRSPPIQPVMVDNPLYTEKHGLDVPCGNYPSDISGTQSKDPIDTNRYSKECAAPQTDNVAAAVNTIPDGATTELTQLQMQIGGMLGSMMLRPF